jgi:hypothetical protein
VKEYVVLRGGIPVVPAGCAASYPNPGDRRYILESIATRVHKTGAVKALEVGKTYTHKGGGDRWRILAVDFNSVHTPVIALLESRNRFADFAASEFIPDREPDTEVVEWVAVDGA